MKITKARLRELIVEECANLEKEGEQTLVAEATADKIDLYIVQANVFYEKAAGTDNVLNKIRAVPGVTRCSTIGEAFPVGAAVLRHLVSIKILREKGSIQSNIERLIQSVALMAEITRIKVLNITQVKR